MGFRGDTLFGQSHVLPKRNSPSGIQFIISRIQTAGFVPFSNPIMSVLEKRLRACLVHNQLVGDFNPSEKY